LPELRFGEFIVEDAPCLQDAYKNTWNNDEELQLVEELDLRLNMFTGNLTLGENVKLRRALEVAFLAHHGQKRLSGEPFVIHPVEVAVILAQEAMDVESIISGLLHDTVEDTALSFEDVEKLFGSTVRRIVEGETEVSKLPKMRRKIENAAKLCPETVQAENLRSMFIAMAQDWRIVVVKLADRLHNMRTLDAMSLVKQQNKARETLEVYVPLAHRFGFWSFKTELGDLSLKYVMPDFYTNLCEHKRTHELVHNETIRLVKTHFANLCSHDPWWSDHISSILVTARSKSPYSIWRKMNRKNCSIDEIMDLIAVRAVITRKADFNQEKENALCYLLLSRLHQSWTPIPGTFKDYIAKPKSNGYQSLHSTILVREQPIEVQIRTDGMHKVAENGGAAHWRYQDQSVSPAWNLEKMENWDSKAESANASEFVKFVREEINRNSIFVFRNDGSIMQLHRGATVEDAAAQLGVNKSLHTVLVNGKFLGLTRTLHTNDVISLRRNEPEQAYRHSGDIRQALMNILAPWEPCKKCSPLPGDNLFGSASQGKLKIHRKGCDCSSLKESGTEIINGGFAQMLLRAKLKAWHKANNTHSEARFVVFGQDRNGVLADVWKAMTETGAYVSDVRPEVLNPGKEVAMDFAVSVRSKSHLKKVVQAVRHVSGVTCLMRGSIEQKWRESPEEFWANCYEKQPP
jgi:GTP pyrophosphokinase